ncbi:SCP2 sterol-binding domain-containing protein [Acidiphilium acidophilum]|uniref:SCP2 sterol-binding domain-containing protein n=1 Tax=Acidiphilium acidophilum TaxID=76588 RepID=A0AAW9DQ95_ACIAO|nr:SCP2 sterol-binding domain-containing protein [Acidiphilium acidophilum]MDX5930222.1 SCP2 sterol-binding domain-containing protein [Acidiphilium acidophilum]
MERSHLVTGAALFMAGAMGVAAAQGTAPAAMAAKPVFMSPQWATQLCTAWNRTPQLTKGLGGGWAQNTGAKRYKIITLSDSICKVSAPIELKIAPKNGLAECIYGGALTATSLDYSHDYSMWATTANWMDMGSPMTAMMFGRLNFKGPKLEAMRNMGPFGGFLHLVPTVPASFKYCPPKGPGLPN